MSIKFSDHARKQLGERGISEKLVISTINNPEKRSKSFKNRTLRKRRFNDRMLEVVTVTGGSRITVITAYYLEESNEN